MGDAPEQAADVFEKLDRGQRLGIDAVTGFINAIVSLPVMCSFAVIIFDVNSYLLTHHVQLLMRIKHCGDGCLHPLKPTWHGGELVSPIDQILQKVKNRSFILLHLLQDKFFRPYSGSLVRLVLLCAAIHQAVFTMLSTIKFAVGQVQDVGLIFLSAIASR